MNKEPNKSCPNCKKAYDESKMPLELPCGHSYCETCLNTCYSENKRLICFSEKKTFDFELTTSQLHMPYYYCKMMIGQKQEKMNLFYMCSKHMKEKEPIKFYCNWHKELLCSLCVWDHADHKDSTQISLEENLLEDIQKVESKIKEMSKVLESLKGKLEDIRSKKIFQSQEIKDFFNEAEKFLINPFCSNICDENKGVPLVIHQIKPLEMILNPFDESLILPQAPNREYIFTMFEAKKINSCKLIFRASRDGFRFEKFHQLCDEKGPTVTLVKSQKGFFFGGFNTISWSSRVGKYKPAEGNFLFSLTQKSKHEIYQNSQYAVYLTKDYGPRFGGGADLHISTNCNQNESSYSNLGHTYKSPYQYDTDKSKNYLAGSYNFRVEDYEVFSITVL